MKKKIQKNSLSMIIVDIQKKVNLFIPLLISKYREENNIQKDVA